MNRFIIIAVFYITPAFGMAAEKKAKPETPGKGELLFALKVKPLMKDKCFACHGEDPEKIKGELILLTLKDALKGGETFGKEVLIPGKAEKSMLYLTAIREEPDFEMPPKEADKLTKEQAWFIRDWINAGAPWPNEERIAWIQVNFAEGVIVKTSGGLNEDWTKRRYKEENLWAYQILKQPPLPIVKGKEQHPIDAFIDDGLKTAKLKPAPRATPRELIRRATYDLIGLPPKPKEIENFLTAYKSDQEKAWNDLIDRLLASPHYGEQWGQHWLDVVRYADSSGFANDYERPNTWRYRDYVIRSFNADKPYDQFIREQIAGDEIDDTKPEMLIATGFLRMGPWEHTGMSVAKITRQQFLDDITDSVGQVFLAHALQCARCHDHKFDPIPTRDYYAMQACFSTTQFGDREAEWMPEENLTGIDEDKRYHQLRSDTNQEMLGRINSKLEKNQKRWLEERNLPYKTRKEALKKKAPKKDVPSRQLGFTPDDFGQERVGRKHENRFKWEFDRYQPIAFSVYSGKTVNPKGFQYGRAKMPDNPMGKGALEKTAILGGGSVFSPTTPVDPGIISATPGSEKATIPKNFNGRRLALADWIANSENVLTTRVIANRIWASHFGQGIAGNPNNFGATGKKPTHPELLDWLAVNFSSNGWSFKQFHRLIMTSETYRRSSAYPDPEALKKRDPNNVSYASFLPRRLTAEELRDSMLACSGELNPEVGGIPARPDMNLEAALQPRMIMGTFAPSYVPHPKPEQRNRRSVYAHKTRGQRDPFLDTFNKPGSETSCELRQTSTVTPQVFALFNGEETYDRSLAMADMVLKEKPSREEAVTRLFQICYGRDPKPEERKVCLQHWSELEKIQNSLKPEPRIFPTEVVRQAPEENTGENFTFTEILHVYKDYVSDLQPYQVNAETRGLADLCLILFNSNEFVYLY